MKSKIYQVISPLNFFFRLLYSSRLRVLAYHTVPDKKVFEKQVSYLSSHYNIIGIGDLLNFFGKRINLPKNPLLITFDDGDVSVLENGLPVLKKHQLESCLFIITGLINTTEGVWIKRVEAKEMEDGKSYWEARQKVRHLKEIKNSARLEEMRKYPPVRGMQLSSKDLWKMKGDGMFIANHSHTHPMFDRCSSVEIQQELNLSKDVFNELNLDGYDIFAYPNGNSDVTAQSILRNHGMKLIFLFDHKINKKKISPFTISRIMVDTDTEINEFKAKVSGNHPFFFNLKTAFKK